MSDATQSFVLQESYTPFGLATVSGPQTLFVRAPGQFFEPESGPPGLYQNGAREYYPALGRYIESDPIGLAGGINTYAYAEGNPVNRIDPSGLADCPDSDPKTKKCKGNARVLQGNANTIGEPGGWSGSSVGNITVAPNSAAVVTSQWGGKAALRPYINGVSGTSNGVPLFNGITDIVGGTVSPIQGMPVGAAFVVLNPDSLIIELPSAPNDMGTIPIELTIPAGLPCPAGTKPVE